MRPFHNRMENSALLMDITLQERVWRGGFYIFNLKGCLRTLIYSIYTVQHIVGCLRTDIRWQAAAIKFFGHWTTNHFDGSSLSSSNQHNSFFSRNGHFFSELLFCISVWKQIVFHGASALYFMHAVGVICNTCLTASATNQMPSSSLLSWGH